MESFKDWLRKSCLWVAGFLGSLVLLVGAYFAGSTRRKGAVELEIATRELDKTNKQYDIAQKKAAEIHTKQKRLVADILSEQLRRAEELKQREGLSDADVIKALRERGDISDSES